MIIQSQLDVLFQVKFNWSGNNTCYVLIGIFINKSILLNPFLLLVP